MKCLLCENQIDDKKEFPVTYSEERRGMVFDEAGQRAHSAELNRWNQIVVSLGPCGELQLIHGHGCPSCTSREGLERISLHVESEPVNPLTSRQVDAMNFL